MSTKVVHGIRKWGPLSVDDEGHRTYKVGILLRTNSKYDGPYQMYNTPGTPLVGSAWSFGNDNDTWAYCLNDCTIERYGTGEDTAVAADSEPWVFWMAEYTFSTKPPDRNKQRCSDNPIENPLLEPYKYSGDFKKYTEEAYFDMYGDAILNSALEQMRGQQVEFDRNRPGVTIEQNVSNLQLPLLSAFVDGVNDRPMWGLPARTIKLSDVSWEKIFYGTCYYYFKRKLGFEVNYETWDRLLLDEGSNVLNGHWHETTRHWVIDPINGQAPDRFNPAHFHKFTDFQGKDARVILDGQGLPAGACIDFYDTTTFDIVPDIYISRTAHIGFQLKDRNHWIKWKPATGETAFAIPPNPWVNNILYKKGNTVTVASGTYSYVALVNNLNDFPITSESGAWLQLPYPTGLNNMGDFNIATTYNIGDYVQSYPLVGSPSAICISGEVASILVQKYRPANFLLLGVPLILPV